ncbi:hypothetical protein FIBSPDRAFT_876248 [Athelia psychrophila]|uniref:Uncharacterized protein n=1 Tax=Athelia psychrophila TaxID=1759441 RepID=A0A167X2D8_9AGAM|nr:hypothetical protein FIBSPDRAFT_876248 [Fibularhizoctonia sp. CBS 109695]
MGTWATPVSCLRASGVPTCFRSQESGVEPSSRLVRSRASGTVNYGLDFHVDSDIYVS